MIKCAGSPEVLLSLIPFIDVVRHLSRFAAEGEALLRHTEYMLERICIVGDER